MLKELWEKIIQIEKGVMKIMGDTSALMTAVSGLVTQVDASVSIIGTLVTDWTNAQASGDQAAIDAATTGINNEIAALKTVTAAAQEALTPATDAAKGTAGS
jgi:hypothetical protein